MDEFDSALDAEYRSGIAQLIFELSRQSQFLITTFKPELIDGADKIFSIDFVNRASEMKEIDKAQAHDFINSFAEANEWQVTRVNI